MSTAVLVIDVQQALCEPPLQAHDVPGTIARINAVTRQARAAAGNSAIAAPQVIAHHNATLANIQSFGPRVAIVPAADLVLAPAS